MIFKIAIGIFLCLYGLSAAGVWTAPGILMAILSIVGGIALLAGI